MAIMSVKDIVSNSRDRVVPPKSNKPVRHINRQVKRPVGDLEDAVITNASLIWRDDVREELLDAHWVSLKMDSVQDETWRQASRPHGRLQLGAILEGALEFARAYRGELATDTMLVEGVNDSDDHLGELGDFSARLKPAAAYLSIRTRPPAEGWVRPPDEQVINRAYRILSR
jgi:wyosine [tRNA(Phe)-imidazoG37] synthetase (radical SAM superfamily)